MTAAPAVSDIDWSISHRIIRTIYPPIWLFEDIADLADWDLIASAEAKTNPRVRDELGDLSLVPAERRLAGPTASLAMSAFTHVSPERRSRFSDGTYGVWYCGDRFEVALLETAHHFEQFMRRTDEPHQASDHAGPNTTVSLGRRSNEPVFRYRRCGLVCASWLVEPACTPSSR